MEFKLTGKVVSHRLSDKGYTYIRVMSEDGEFNFSARGELPNVPLNERVEITGVCTGSSWEGAQRLQLVRVNFKKVA